MFGKLVANLPFNPGMLTQVSFYAKRLHREKSIRSVGFVLVAISLVVQMFAALYPAQKSLAASPNHILNGLTNKASLLSAWDSNSGNIQAIYGRFGITRANIADISGQSPNATISSTGKDYWSIGRLPLTNFGISGVTWGERAVYIGNSVVYQRPLHAWDTSGSSNYKAFHGKNQYGKEFWILQDCANLTFTGAYIPKEPKPKLEIHKTLLTPATTTPGETVKFRVEYQNTVNESLATDFNVTDTLDSNFEFVGATPGVDSRSGNTLVIDHGKKLGYSPTAYSNEINVKVKAGVKNGTVICNQASASSSQSSDKSEKRCVTVVTKCTVKAKESLSATDSKCFVVCASNTSVPASSPSCGQCSSGREKVAGECLPVCPAGQTRQTNNACKPADAQGYCVSTSALAAESGKSFIARTTAYVVNGTSVEGYNYDLESDGSTNATTSTAATTDSKTFSNLSPGRHEVTVTVLLNNAGQKLKVICKTEVSVSEDARVIQSKTVSDKTQDKADASGQKINNGDELVFTLTTQNVTQTDYPNYKGEDYFGDVLDYADFTDATELTKQGLTLDANRYLHWQEDIKASSSSVKTIHVKVKEVIPSTNRPSGTSDDYDCVISNKYGNEVTMTVGCPLIKNIDQISTKLPNTGPGTNLVIGFGVTVIAGYFFSRSRLLAKELDIIKADYAGAGGV